MMREWGTGLQGRWRSIRRYFRNGIYSMPSWLRREKIALISRMDGLGDVLLWLSAAKAITDHFHRKGWKVLLICRDYTASLMESTGFFDRVIGINGEQMQNRRYRKRLFRGLARNRYQIALNPRFSREICLDDSIIQAVWARSKVGVNLADGGLMSVEEKQLSERWYTRLHRPDRIVMELANNAWMAAQVTGIPQIPAIFPLPIRKPAPSPFRGGDYFVVVPFTADARRNWPWERFLSIIRLVQGKHRIACVLLGTDAMDSLVIGADTSLGKGESRSIYNVLGKTTFQEYLDYISNARFVLCNDSSPYHLAVALQVRAFVVASENTATRFLDYQSCVLLREHALTVFRADMDCRDCLGHCIHPLSDEGNWQCVDRISVEEVWNGIDNVLSYGG